MENETLERNLWEDYLVVGTTVAMLLTILDLPVVYQIIPFAIVFIATGLKGNLRIMHTFLKKNLVIAVFVAVYIVLVIFGNRSIETVNNVTAMVFTSLSGIMLVKRSAGNQIRAYQKLWVLLLAVILLGISNMVRNGQVGYFMDYTAEFAMAIIFITLTLLFMEGRWLKVVSITAGGIAIALTSKKLLLNMKNAMSVWNTFPEYYSILMLVLYITIFGIALYLFFKSDDLLLRKQALLAGVMMVMVTICFFSESNNISFAIWSGVGIMLGRYEFYKNNVNVIIE